MRKTRNRRSEKCPPLGIKIGCSWHKSAMIGRVDLYGLEKLVKKLEKTVEKLKALR